MSTLRSFPPIRPATRSLTNISNLLVRKPIDPVRSTFIRASPLGTTIPPSNRASRAPSAPHAREQHESRHIWGAAAAYAHDRRHQLLPAPPPRLADDGVSALAIGRALELGPLYGAHAVAEPQVPQRRPHPQHALVQLRHGASSLGHEWIRRRVDDDAHVREPPPAAL